ncbi:MAG: TRAP transporter small permease subunit [Alphaproteobacteria bacterium]|nr:TRAP transporter small permease subunit [Alphaproteobacteria bacterium]
MTLPDVPGADSGARQDNWLFFALKLVAAVMIFAMAILTFLDVVGRYVFAAPIQGTFEIVGLLLGVVTFSALPLVTYSRTHITVDLFDSFIRGRFRWIQQFCVLIGSAIVVAFFTERLFSAGLDEAAANYVTEDLGLSRAPLLYGLSGLSAITTILLLMMIWQMATGKLKVKQPDQLPADPKPTDKSAP